MNKLYLIFILLLVACGPMTPEERGIKVTDDFKIYNQDKAMFTLQYTIEDYYNVRMDNDFIFQTKVYWTDTPCPYSDDWAVVYKGKCNAGRMWSCQEMYVAKKKSDPDHTCGTALLHEFGHCIRQELGFSTSGDDHWDDEFWGVVAEADAISCNRGW